MAVDSKAPEADVVGYGREGFAPSTGFASTVLDLGFNSAKLATYHVTGRRSYRLVSQEDANMVTPMRGSGCDRCNSTGYRGRVGLYEVMEISDELRELILVGASGLELRRKAIDEGMITLRQSGLRKVKDGLTTIEEVVRETVK